MLDVRSRPVSVELGPAFAAFLLWCAPASGAEIDQFGVAGVALHVLGLGGPELQDKRASSSYLIWWNGHARVLMDIGVGAALRFGQSGGNVTGLDVILLTHLHVDYVGDLPALVKSSYFEDRRDALPVFGPTGNSNFSSTTRFIRDLFAAPHGAFRYLSELVMPAQGGAYLLTAGPQGFAPTAAKPAAQSALAAIYQGKNLHAHDALISALAAQSTRRCDAPAPTWNDRRKIWPRISLPSMRCLMRNEVPMPEA
jgi:ribonuclease BN (tRNA processing enzyme)